MLLYVWMSKLKTTDRYKKIDLWCTIDILDLQSNKIKIINNIVTTYTKKLVSQNNMT